MSGNDNQDDVSEEEPMRKPPFVVSGTYPDQSDPPHPHKAAEAIINVAAKHTFPNVDKSTSLEKAHEDEGRSDGRHVTKEGTKQAQTEDEDKLGRREEKPLVGGTPLDEMTPVVEKSGEGQAGSGFPFKPSSSSKSSGRDGQKTVPEIKEPEDGSSTADIGDDGDASGSNRPGFGAGHEMGSVSVVVDLSSPCCGVSRL